MMQVRGSVQSVGWAKAPARHNNFATSTAQRRAHRSWVTRSQMVGTALRAFAHPTRVAALSARASLVPNEAALVTPLARQPPHLPISNARTRDQAQCLFQSALPSR